MLANIEAAGERRAIRSMVRGHRAAYLGGLRGRHRRRGAAGRSIFANRARRVRTAS